MAINPYFKSQRDEQNVLEDLAIETIKIHGQDMVYMPRTLVNEDSLFGEDVQSAFNDGYEIEMYISTVDGFEGEGDIIARFGLQINDTCTLVVSRKRFTQLITANDSDILKPREGDLIFFPLTGGIFEITFVEDENPFYQLGRLYTYDLKCELKKYSRETLNTGWSDIDSLDSDRENLVTILNVSTSTGNFRVGETVTDALGATAEVVGWDSSAKKLEVIGASDLTFPGGVTGASSGVFGAVGTTSAPDTPVDTTTDPFGNNSDIQGEGYDFINFSDTDPFSEGNF